MYRHAVTEDGGSTEVSLGVDTGKIRILLVDDHTFVGSAIKVMLDDQTDMEIEYCSRAEEAIEKAQNYKPHIILQDLIMPGFSPVDLISQYSKDQELVSIPLLVLSNVEDPEMKMTAFENGASDYMVKPPQRAELIARLRYHAKAYNDYKLRTRAVRMIRQSQQMLLDEIALAASYVRSLLPGKIETGPVKADWVYLPSRHLGGDMLGYQWLDDDHFLIYALDIAGHGFRAALMAVTAMNLINHHLLPGANYYKPTTVLQALSDSFKMKDNDEMFITMWYGIYNRKTRTLAYANAAHPPAMLVWAEGGKNHVKRLDSDGIMLGTHKDYSFELNTTAVPPGARLYIFSDGAFDFTTTEGEYFGSEKFYDLLADMPDVQAIMEKLKSLTGQNHFPDDVSIMEIRF